MNRKRITAYLVNCQIDEFLVYRDEKEKGTVAVGPDGKKYRFSNDQLEQGVIRMRADLTKELDAEVKEVADIIEQDLHDEDKIREEKEAEEEAAAVEQKTEPKPEPKAAPKKRAQAKRSTSATKKKPSKNSPAR